MAAKELQALVDLLPHAKVTSGGLAHRIEHLVYDSRAAQANTLFVCLAGAKVDGHDYIAKAHQQGAVAALVEKDVAAPEGMTIIRVPDTRLAMQSIAPYFFDYPAHKLRMIGVTGTNGKTTTTYLIRYILQTAGYRVGLIGTINSYIGDQVLPVKNTTPDVIELQSLLRQMADARMDYVVMEVSSHALALGRVAGCEYDVGVFTNLTQDHLDFHKTLENYRSAKAQLFTMLAAQQGKQGAKAAVINLDDPAGQTMIQAAGKVKVLTYGIRQAADLLAQDIDVQAKGASCRLRTPQGELALQLKITGIFNIYNMMAACGVALAEGVPRDTVRSALESFRSVAGRFEIVDAGQPFSVIVDYAHTPDGLENILRTAGQFAKGRIISVFGCGGDRDKTKRPIMGKLAATLSDIVIATSDNPRSEDPVQILKEIEAGVKEGLTANTYEVIVERREAIKRAISLAQPDDIVIIAGKGHETYQILKDQTIHFDDREVAREYIEEMK